MGCTLGVGSPHGFSSDVFCILQSRGNWNRGQRRLWPDYFKGGESGWEFQTYDVASIIGTMQCSGALVKAFLM